ncbi:hypothetical protein ABEG70_22150 [Pantoea agglomerans]|uniref:hypothetical protein n=1 Tax=Enterobacter agglomerans TaxID=549 RepID=UPI000F5F9E3E|nr:hypothetical protein [Pantoea agglomerans]AZI53150.1 hypothetical protein CBF16_19995 [Pantoea agglomerans]
MKKLKLWCYLNIENPLVAWEVAIGRIASLEALPSLQGQERRWFLTQWQYSRLKNAFCNEPTNKIPLINEFRIESVRHRFYNHKVSRLRGSFFFKSEDDAKNIVKYYGWKGFNPNYLSEVEVYYKNDEDITYYDSTWFTMKANDIMTVEDIKFYLSNTTYWGKDTNPATEVLVYGLGFIINEDLIQKAYNNVRATNPESLCFVDSARFMLKACKMTINSETPNWELYEAGLSCSFNTYNDGDKYCNVTYLMRDHPFRKYGILQDGYPEKIRTPNFTELFYSYPKDEFLQIMGKHLNVV